MIEEDVENQKEEPEGKTFSMKGVAKFLAVLYVLAIYFLIFLKILFLK